MNRIVGKTCATGRNARVPAQAGHAAPVERGEHIGPMGAHSAATCVVAGNTRASRISSVPLIAPLRPSS